MLRKLIAFIYRKETFIMVSFFSDMGKIMDKRTAFVLICEHYKWSARKAIDVYAICIYCGYLKP